MTTDEGIRESTLEKLASLKPSFKEDGGVTAGELLADHRRRRRRC